MRQAVKFSKASGHLDLSWSMYMTVDIVKLGSNHERR